MTCPEPDPVIDRSFASQPPACVWASFSLTFKGTDAYGIALADSAETSVDEQECRRKTQDWIESERLARDNVEGLAHD